MLLQKIDEGIIRIFKLHIIYYTCNATKFGEATHINLVRKI